MMDTKVDQALMALGKTLEQSNKKNIKNKVQWLSFETGIELCLGILS